MIGWIKLHRQIVGWEWYDDPNTFKLFIHLLLTANHEPKQWRGVIIERGQRVFGRKKLAEETNLSEQTLRTCLSNLQSTSELTIKSTNKFSIVTINRYNDYQTQEMTNQQTNQQNVSQLTNNQPQLKNDKNIRKKETIVVVASDAPTPAQEARKFFDDEQYREEIIAKLVDGGANEDFVRREVKRFCYYWTERNKSGTKCLWETKQTFEVRRRLSTWLNRSSSPHPNFQKSF